MMSQGWNKGLTKETDIRLKEISELLTGRTPEWTEERKQYVIDNYGKKSAEYIAKTLGTTEDAIRMRACILGITKKKRPLNHKLFCQCDICKAYRREELKSKGKYHTIKQAVSHTCPRCMKSKVNSTHHILPRKYGGGNFDENMIGLCIKCHDEVEILTCDLLDNNSHYTIDDLRSFIKNNSFPNQELITNNGGLITYSVSITPV